MNEKVVVKWVGQKCFSEEKLQFVRSVKEVTDIFKQIVLDFKSVPWTINEFVPRGVFIDPINERVGLAMSDCYIDDTGVYGSFIEGRIINDGFEVGGIRVRGENMRPAIDQQVNELIEKRISSGKVEKF